MLSIDFFNFLSLKDKYFAFVDFIYWSKLPFLSTDLTPAFDTFNLRLLFKISLLTLLIWGLEISSTIYLINFIGFEIDILILLGVYIAFSSLLPNGPLGIGGLQLSFYYLFDSFDLNLDYGSLSYTYVLFIFGSGLLLGGLLFSFDLLKKILVILIKNLID
mgnify:CR=1 FL=1